MVDGPDDYKAAEVIAVVWVNEGKKGMSLSTIWRKKRRTWLRRILMM